MVYLVPIKGVKRAKNFRVHLSNNGVTSYCKKVTLPNDFIAREKLKGGVERYSICYYCDKIKRDMLTDEQKEYLLKNNSEMTYKEMCEKLNISSNSVVKFLKGKGKIKGIKNTKVKERDDAIVKKYDGSNAEQLAVEYGIRRNQVHNIITRARSRDKRVEKKAKTIESKPINKEEGKINYVFKSSLPFCNNDQCNNDCERCKKIRFVK